MENKRQTADRRMLPHKTQWPCPQVMTETRKGHESAWGGRLGSGVDTNTNTWDVWKKKKMNPVFGWLFRVIRRRNPWFRLLTSSSFSRLPKDKNRDRQYCHVGYTYEHTSLGAGAPRCIRCRFCFLRNIINVLD